MFNALSDGFCFFGLGPLYLVMCGLAMVAMEPADVEPAEAVSFVLVLTVPALNSAV